MILVVCNEESGLVVNRLQVIQTVGRNENGKNENLRQVTFSTGHPEPANGVVTPITR